MILSVSSLPAPWTVSHNFVLVVTESIAKEIFSLGNPIFFADSMCCAKRLLVAGSGPPTFTAVLMRLAMRPKVFPFSMSFLAFWCLIFAGEVNSCVLGYLPQWLWPAAVVLEGLKLRNDPTTVSTCTLLLYLGSKLEDTYWRLECQQPVAWDPEKGVRCATEIMGQQVSLLWAGTNRFSWFGTQKDIEKNRCKTLNLRSH